MYANLCFYVKDLVKFFLSQENVSKTERFSQIFNRMIVFVSDSLQRDCLCFL